MERRLNHRAAPQRRRRAGGAILALLALAACGEAESEFEAARRHGREVYLANCAPCHGVAADGNGPQRHMLDSAPRDHGDPAWRATVDHETVYRTIVQGMPGTAMPAWSTLPEDDLHDVTLYVLSVAELGPFVEGEEPPPAPR